MTDRDDHWLTANQRYLMARIAVVREALRRTTGAHVEQEDDAARIEKELTTTATALSAPAALDRLCAAFGLSAFERDVVLLCAGMELDGHWAALCASAQGSEARAYPTFALALAALPGAHWTAITPAGALRRWRIVELSPSETITAARIALDERVLHYLTGVSYLDDRLAALTTPMPAAEGLLAPSHEAIAKVVAVRLGKSLRDGMRTAVHLSGTPPANLARVAATIASLSGLRAYALPISHTPSTAAERGALARLWERDARLAPALLYVEIQDGDLPRDAAEFFESLDAAFIVGSRSPVRLAGDLVWHVDVPQPSIEERRALWISALGKLAPVLKSEIDAIAAHFLVTPATMRAIATQLAASTPPRRKRRHNAGDDDPDALLKKALWSTCRVEARVDLDELAQRIEPRATWNDLVLPIPQKNTLREIAAQVRHRATVYETWGFAAKADRGLGISALFSGSSGTGKTMAAEVLANALGLDLYRIDLSQIVSKYIGETEKNLRRVFDAAERGGAILLFDEADALFGKRSEVKDSHDRYANIEVSYLLQRMESYHGLAILTTNSKSALDQAFMRRIRFAITFPFPDTAQRAEIWQRVFPAAVPTEALDSNKLARLNLPGGNIRNIAMGAAFLAADAGEPVRMTHLLRAARTEAAKLERPLTDAEVGSWA